MDNIATILGIIATICAGALALGKGMTFLNQSPISLTLLSHNEREHHKSLRDCALIIRLALTLFLLGLIINIFTLTLVEKNNSYHTGTNIQIEKDNEEITPQNLITEETKDIVVEEKREKNFDRQIMEWISSVSTKRIILPQKGENVFTFIAAIIPLIFILLQRGSRKKRKNNIEVKCNKIEKLDRIVSYLGIYMSILCVEEILYCGVVFDTRSYLFSGLAASVFFAIGFFTANIKMFGNRGEEALLAAQVKTTNEIVFLYEMKDDYFVAGNDIRIADCSKYYMLEPSELKQPIISVRKVVGSLETPFEDNVASEERKEADAK